MGGNLSISNDWGEWFSWLWWRLLTTGLYSPKSRRQETAVIGNQTVPPRFLGPARPSPELKGEIHTPISQGKGQASSGLRDP